MAKFIVEIPDTPGLSKRDLKAYITAAIKAEAGHYLPGDPQFALTKQRSKMRVTPVPNNATVVRV